MPTAPLEDSNWTPSQIRFMRLAVAEVQCEVAMFTYVLCSIVDACAWQAPMAYAFALLILFLSCKAP